MSANPGGDGFSAGYSSAQVELAKSLASSMTPAGSKSRPGHARGSAPSPAASAGRGRGGHATAATRPVASATPSPNPYHSFGSATAPKTTHAPGATKSGASNPHFAQYSVGASTAAPVFKSPPRARAVSPVRGFGGPAAVPTLKPKSPSKLRSSILVPNSAQPMVPPAANPMHGGPQGQSAQVDPQSGWVNVPEQSSAYFNPTPAAGGWSAAQASHDVDPRFTAVQSSHPMTQQLGGSFFGGQSQYPAVQAHHTMPSAHADVSFGASQGQGPLPYAGELASEAVSDPGRVRITTNWTDDDPTKPIIPGHLRQPDGEKVVVEIAGNAGFPASNLGQGVMTVGISSSIHAPGNTKGNFSASRPNPTRYQSDVNDNQWMAAATNRNHKTGSNRIPSGDGDVEMSDVQANTRSSAPQGPVEWNNLPTLAASKYASPARFSSNPPNVPKLAPTTNVGNENVKPTQQVSAQGFGGFGDINKNIAADLAKNFGAPGQPMFNPFIGNGSQAIQNPTQASGFGAAAMDSAGVNPFHTTAVGSGSAQPASSGFGAPSAPPAGGPISQYSVNGQNSRGVSHSDDRTAQMIQNTSDPNQNDFGAPSTPPTWRSVDHSASNGPNGFSTGVFGASVQPALQAQTAQTSNNGFDAQATGGWGPGAQSASNGQSGVSGFGFSQNDPANQSATNAPGGSSSNGQTVHGFGAPQSASMGQVKVNPFMSNGPGATSQPAAVNQVKVNPFLSNGFGATSQPTAANQGAYNNPFMSNGGPSTQNQFNSQGFGAPTTNAQLATAPGHGGFDASKLAASINNDIRRMYSGKAAAPSYEASPFAPPVVRSAAASSASGNRQPGSGPPVYQVVPESKKTTGLAASRWA